MRGGKRGVGGGGQKYNKINKNSENFNGARLLSGGGLSSLDPLSRRPADHTPV